MSMKEIIQDRLGKMEDLNQRRILKNLMTGLFLNMVEYQEEMNRKLEERIFHETGDSEERHDVYVSICSREDVDPIHEFLAPMVPEDAEVKRWDMKRLTEKLAAREEVVLMTIFLGCGHDLLKPLLNGRRTFQGELVTTGGRRRIGVMLRQCQTYIQAIEQLYQVFQKNSLPWKTVYNPYAYKFFDVILTDSGEALREEEEITEIRIRLEEYEPYKLTDMVPIWNIERLALKNIGFPIPAMDRVNFEHVLSLRKTGTEHGYLVDGDEADIRYIKRTEEELTIVSPREKSGVWNVLKIARPVQTRIGSLEYALLSNKRMESFIRGFAKKQALIVRAKGEILRIANSFEAASDLELEHISVEEDTGSEGETYAVNPFISDYVRVDSGRKRMRLCFRPTGSRSFTHQDLMSFLVSEIQMYFPEYRCVGEWA
jgi:hypothetical protein